jgi:hypothetical protein
MESSKVALRKMREWHDDWCTFAKDVLHARLDEEQKAILRSVQHNKMTAVASGTARGKDYIAACAAMCFMYLTPKFDKSGNLKENTKIAMTAPTGRQVTDIMIPEISRLFKKAGFLPGRLLSTGIRTDYEEWYLTGFKSAEDNTEAWSGFHAVNTMFVVTEASGISDSVYNAIEGNLQGNSRLLIVFNPNITTGYAARAMKSSRFSKFRLSSLNAENVVSKKNIIPGQVDYEWVADKVTAWAQKIRKSEFDEGRGDFVWEGGYYTPNDLFRVKVLGMFPRVSEDTLIPMEWVELANKRWRELQDEGYVTKRHLRLGVDVAGMGRDRSCFVARFDNYVSEIKCHNSRGTADHMEVAGITRSYLMSDKKAKAFIDTIGEGAGVYSRLIEQKYLTAFSCKFSEGVRNKHDVTGCYSFANMRAYLFWCIRDWLNPKNGFFAALPPDDELDQELCEVHWLFQSDGSIIMEPKDEIKKRLKRSPDKMDALANTFYPYDYDRDNDLQLLNSIV